MIKVVPFPRKGLGVVAARAFHAGEVIETVPVLTFSPEEWLHVEKTVLYNYCFGWGKAGDQAALALGAGSLYNHSYQPNAVYRKDYDARRIAFVARRDIAEGEEITINYNGDPDDRAPMWFGEVA